MRPLGSMALLVMTGCGLGLSGLGPEPSDGAPSTWTVVDGRSPFGEASDDGGRRLADAQGKLAEGDARAPNEAGQGPPGVTLADGANGVMRGSDAAVDPGRDARASDAIDAAATANCLGSIPAGWTVALLGVGAAACPAAFAQHDVYGPPVAAAGACSCACSVTQSGDCTTGTVSVAAGMPPLRGSCTTNLFSAQIAGSGCTPLDGVVLVGGMLHLQTAALDPVGGSCTGSVTPDPTGLSTPRARYCDVPEASAESVCAGVVSSGFVACIAADGDVPCPETTPFVNPSSVGDGATLTCSACSPCSATTTCANATLTTFRDPTCAPSRSLQITADGTCSAAGQGGQTFVSAIEYSATASTSCTPGSSAATARLANARTLCCR
jgi:hypothetical protein